MRISFRDRPPPLPRDGLQAKPTGCSSAASGRFWIPWAPADAGAPQPSANGLSVGLLLGSERAQLYALASAASAVDLSGASRARASIEARLRLGRVRSLWSPQLLKSSAKDRLQPNLG